jgi:hypothetical protein
MRKKKARIQKSKTPAVDMASEALLFTAGFLLLMGIGVVFVSGSFIVWTIAKVFYAAGAVLFLFHK